uniref:Tape measure protein n=1 Tax=Vibrio phage Vc1 TaxID=1480731 RepID=A0A6M5CDM6_9CAUD
MAEQFAGLTLGVDINQVNKAVKSLQEFKKANDDAASGVKILKKAGLLLLVKQNKWLATDTQITKLNLSKKALTEEGRAALEESRAKESGDDWKNFLADLQAQANALGKLNLNCWKLEMKAAQLGVTAQAAPFIAQLKAQEKQLKMTGISAGQYNRAMRMLPAQITDVVTSLASGMPVWLVAIQQGGQIKDSFGGIGNSLRALKSLITPARLGIAGIAGAMGALVKASWDAYASQRDLENALILTGNMADLNGDKFINMSRSIAEANMTTVGTAQEAILSIVKTGEFSANQIQKVAKSTQQLSSLTGKSIDEAAGAFERLAEDPIEGLLKLNDQVRFLEDGQLTLIDSIRKTEGEAAALDKALQLAAEGMQNAHDQMIDSALPLQRMWMNIKTWASEAWQTVGIYTNTALLGTIDTVKNVIAAIKNLISQADASIFGFMADMADRVNKVNENLGISFRIDENGEWRKGQQEALKLLRKQPEHMTDSKTWGEYEAEVRKGYEVQRNESPATNAQLRKEKKAIQIATGKQARKRQPIELMRERKRKSNISVKFCHCKQSLKFCRITKLQTELKVLQDHKTVNDKISAQRKQLFTIEAQHAILIEASKNASLANYDKTHELAKQKAELGDQIETQKRLNALQDKATKFIQEQDAALKALDAQKQGMSDRDFQREQARQKLIADWLSQGGQASDARLQEQLSKLNEVYAKQDELSMNAVAGMKTAMSNWLESATEMGAQFGNVMTAALDGVSDQFVDLLSTGKASFKDFANSIIKMILQIITKLSIAYAIQAAMGWVGAGSGGGFAGGFRGRLCDWRLYWRWWKIRSGWCGSQGRICNDKGGNKADRSRTKEATKRIGVDNLYKMMRDTQTAVMLAEALSLAEEWLSGSAPSLSIGNISVDVNNGSDPKGLTNGVKAIVAEELNKCFSQGGRGYEFVMERTNSNISPSNGAFIGVLKTKEATKRIGVDNLYKMMRDTQTAVMLAEALSLAEEWLSGSAPSLSIGNISVDVNNGSDPKGLTNGVKAIVAEELNKCFSQGGRGYEFVMERTNSNISPSNGAFIGVLK